MTSCLRFWSNNGKFFSEHSVHERGLAYIRPPDYGDETGFMRGGLVQNFKFRVKRLKFKVISAKCLQRYK
jgi:hypothetical protein